MIRDDEVVGVNGICQFGDAFKHIRVGNPLQLERGLVLFMHGLDLDFFGVGQQCAGDNTGFVAERLHAEQRMRRLMGEFCQAAQLVTRENHEFNDSKPRRGLRYNFKRAHFWCWWC